MTGPIPRFAVVSHVFPPAWSGQSVVLLRLLKGFDPGAYRLITRRTGEPRGTAGTGLPPLPAECIRVPDVFQLERGSRFGAHRLRRHVNGLLRIAGVRGYALRLARILRREECRLVVACSGDLLDIPSGYLASRMAGLPFVAYLFDDYALQWTEGTARLFAAAAARVALKGARRVIVPNERLAASLRRRYGIEPAVLHNPCTLDAYEAPLPAVEGPGRDPRIVYTGAVYAAQLDAMLNLLAALNSLRRPEVKLHLYTAVPPEELARMGVAGPVVVHAHEGAETVARVQRTAGILFLPLAFDSPYPREIIRTSAPGKTGEYLAARRPILVHAPADSFVARYFRRHDCGLVVSENDPVRLAEAIDRLLHDEALGRRLASNAWARARADFDAARAPATFARVLHEAAGTVPARATPARQRRKVLILASWYPTREAPMDGIFIEEQARELARRYDVAVLAPSVTAGRRELLRRPARETRAETRHGIPVFRERAHLPVARPLSLYYRAYECIVRLGYGNVLRAWGKPDILHAHVTLPGGWAATRVARLPRIPVVITEHTGPFSRLLDSALPRELVREALAHAARIVAVSPDQARQIAAFQPGLVPTVIGNLIRTDFFTPAADRPAAAGPVRFLCVARLSREKGVHHLLHAFHLVAGRGRSEFRLDIAGDGPERTNLERMSRELGISPRCRFVGLLDRPGIRTAMQDCHALVLPSLSESFGIVLGEAMACGKPVIATRCGGPEFVLAPEAGLLVAPGDPLALAGALERILDGDSHPDPERIRESVRERFGPEAFLRHTSELYETVWGEGAACATS